MEGTLLPARPTWAKLGHARGLKKGHDTTELQRARWLAMAAPLVMGCSGVAPVAQGLAGRAKSG